MDREQVDRAIMDLVTRQGDTIGLVKATSVALEESTRRIDEHFEGVNKRLDTLNGKVARHEQELHQQKVDAVQQMATVVESLKNVHTQLAVLTASSAKHDSYITAETASRKATWRVATFSGTIGAFLMGLIMKVPTFVSSLQQFMK
jgi:methylthioribose-1-phosphate isomerase